MSRIPNHFVRASLSGIDAKEGEIESLLANAGITLSSYYQPQGWIKPEQYIALVQSIWDHSNDEFFGLTEQRCKPGLFAIMARMSNHYSSLRTVFEEWVNLYNVTREDLSLGFVVDGDKATISFELANPEKDPMHFLTEFTLVTMHRFASWLTGRHIQLQQVSLAYPKPAHFRFYKDLFPCTVLFDQPSTTFTIDASDLSLPLIRNQRELSQALKSAPAAFLELPDDDHSYSNRTRVILLNFYRQEQRFPNLDEAADHLAVSQRTLRRKLKLEGNNYQEIKDRIRQDIAIDKLKRENISLEDIALQLGFSEQHAFARAFKRWTQLSPAKYRDQTLAMHINGTSDQASYSVFY